MSYSWSWSLGNLSICFCVDFRFDYMELLPSSLTPTADHKMGKYYMLVTLHIMFNFQEYTSQESQNILDGLRS